MVYYNSASAIFDYAKRVITSFRCIQHKGVSSPIFPDILDPTPLSYLLLPQDDDSPRFDGVPGCQVVASTQLLTILVSLPLAVPCGPGDADVMPPSITYLQGQLGNLQWQYIVLS